MLKKSVAAVTLGVLMLLGGTVAPVEAQSGTITHFVQGNGTLLGVARGPVDVRADMVLNPWGADTYVGSFTLDPVQTTLQVGGSYPIDITIRFEEVGSTVVSTANGTTVISSQQQIWLESAKLGGFFELVLEPATCRAREVTSFTIIPNGDFDLLQGGGALRGTYDISDFVDCGFWTWLLTFATESNQNLVDLTSYKTN